MKNIKMLATGFVAGAACMVATTAIAANLNVSATLLNDVFFNFNGETVASPSDQPVLNYNDRIYVPIRFVAEKLNSDVDWDIAGRKVIIKSPEPEVKVVEKIVEKEVPVYINEEESEEGKKVYSSLPIKKTESDFNLTVTDIQRKTASTVTNPGTKILLELDNKGDNNLQLVQAESKLVVDGKSYALDRDRNAWDKNWYQDVLAETDDNDDDEREGYLAFESIPEDYQKMTLELTVRTNGLKDEKTSVLTFNIKK